MTGQENRSEAERPPILRQPVRRVRVQAGRPSQRGAAPERTPVICLAHGANQMGKVEGDFEKGAVNGPIASLAVINLIARSFLARRGP